MTTTSTSTNTSYNGPFYIFSFRNNDCHDLRKEYFTSSKTSYWRGPARIHSAIGAFKLVYLNSKIGKDNYVVEAPTQSKICNMLGSAGILDNEIMGYHIIVKDSEYAMYVRFATEELIHPKFGLTFSKCFKIPDMNKTISELSTLIEDYNEASNKEKLIKDVAKRYTSSYGGIYNIPSSLETEIKNYSYVLNHAENDGIILDKELKDSILNLTVEYNDIIQKLSSASKINATLGKIYRARESNGSKNIITAREKVTNYIDSYISGV